MFAGASGLQLTVDMHLQFSTIIESLILGFASSSCVPTDQQTSNVVVLTYAQQPQDCPLVDPIQPDVHRILIASTSVLLTAAASCSELLGRQVGKPENVGFMVLPLRLPANTDN